MGSLAPGASDSSTSRHAASSLREGRCSRRRHQAVPPARRRACRQVSVPRPTLAPASTATAVDAQLFAQFGCRTCHSTTGQPSVGPRSTASDDRHAPDRLRATSGNELAGQAGLHAPCAIAACREEIGMPEHARLAPPRVSDTLPVPVQPHWRAGPARAVPRG